MDAFLLIFHVLLALTGTCTGAFFHPTAYTLNGVMSVNGSDATGGCPQACNQTISTDTYCDCTETAGAGTFNGSIIDSVVPTLDTSQRGTWATQLLTMGMNSQTFRIGFRFQNTVMLHEVELYLFYCPPWDIGGSPVGTNTINIYNAILFPTFVNSFGGSVGSVTLTSDMANCESLTRVSIFLQGEHKIYFLEFTNPQQFIGWIHIAEVRFSDETTTSPSIVPTYISLISSSTMALQTASNNPLSQTETSIIRQTSAITTPHHTASPTPTTITTGNQLGAIVGGLVAAIVVLLILLLIGGVVIFLCFTQNKRKSYHTEVEQLQGAVYEDLAELGTKLEPTKITTHTHHYEKTELEMKMRSQSSPSHLARPNMPDDNKVAYSKPNQNKMNGQPQFIGENGYSDIDIHDNEAKLESISTKDGEVDAEYFTIGETKKEKETGESGERGKELDSSSSSPRLGKRLYSVVQKQEAPRVPKKMPELCGDPKADEDYYSEVDDTLKESIRIGKEGKSAILESAKSDAAQEESQYYSVVSDANEKKVSEIFIGECSETEREGTEEEIYSEIREKSTPNTSGPQILRNPVFENMDANPTYKSSTVILSGVQDGDEIYTNPDADMQVRLEDSLNVYDTYNEPLSPSMFNKYEELAETLSTNTDHKEKEPEPKNENEDSEDMDEELICAPIYSVSPLENDSSKKLLEVKSENLHKIKTLGTGNFGKVILANTVDLSPKDLKMSDTDDDKTKSTRVAVKQLKLSVSSSIKEAFDKELKFMSRLNHPNVIRVLGACTQDTDTPFIVMEYMKKGDLHEYLLNFETISQGSNPPTDLTISTGTLTSMSAQIASAMKYLASRNFIHRDLAIRNCLVGSDLQMKIADFGLSRSLYESHYYVIKGHAVLPVRWMARECFYGKFSAKTDVWAFGVTMWEIFTLAKDVPYEDMDDKEVIEDATKNDGSRKLLQEPKDCPQGVYDVMLQCWKENPKERATFEKLHNALSLLTVNVEETS